MSGPVTRRSGFAPGADTLAMASRALSLVVSTGCTAEDALEQVSPPPPQKPAVRAILTGTLRWYLRLTPAIDALMHRPGRKPQPELHALLVSAAHQIEYSRAVAQSAVNIAVDAVRLLDLAGAAGLVNAILRRFVGEHDALFAQVDRRPAAASAHPRWFVQQLEATYGEQAAAICAANNEHPPMTLRIDLTRGTRAAYLAELAAQGMEAVAGFVPTAIVLTTPCAVDALPGFAEGRVSVQDAGAQVAAYLVDAQPGERVLDACAAPGGKTGHLLEHTPGIGEVIALDITASRLARVAENLRRQQRTATLVHADLADDPGWWDCRPFDRILLDAPCSSTGVIRRHPDIKLLRRAGDIAVLAQTQLKLLRRCLTMLKPGGLLVYATCSVLPEENAAVVTALLAEDWTGLRLLKARELTLPPTVPRGAGDVQLLPRQWAGGAENMSDGFYYAVLQAGGTPGNAG